MAAGTATCPAHHTVNIRAGVRHRVARFGRLCQSCSLRADCTKARRGRVISIRPQEAALQHAKARRRDPAWQQDYRTHRPVVERKISHFTRRRWGGRKTGCRVHKRILTFWRHQPRPTGNQQTGRESPRLRERAPTAKVPSFSGRLSVDEFDLLG